MRLGSKQVRQTVAVKTDMLRTVPPALLMVPKTARPVVYGLVWPRNFELTL
jgi:hypothetical protein